MSMDRIEELREGILEVENLIAEGSAGWCLGDPHECLESMQRELAELEFVALDQEAQSETFKTESAGWLNGLSRWCREANDNWWRDTTGEPLATRNKGELIALMHSELSECLEGVRKNIMDDHLPNRKMEEVELADCLVRIFDYAGGFGLDIGGAFVEKMAYNAKRADHKLENRLAEGGKEF